MPSIGAAELGATSFCASCHVGDQCGANGLPLTPHSICILGRFQRLKKVDHPRLCKYVDLQREKHERVIVVEEHYPQNLCRNLGTGLSCESLLQVSHDILSGLSHLHSDGLVHRNLSPQNILIDSTGRVKLSAYGLFYMTGNGVYVSFPIGAPKYMAPEILCGGLKTPPPPRLDINEPMQFDSDAIVHMSSSPKVDVWSLGIILLEALMGELLWESLSLREIFIKILGLVKRDLHPFDVLIKEFHQVNKLKTVSPDFIEFLRRCLTLMPTARPTVEELLQLPLFSDVFDIQRPCTNALDIFSTDVRSRDIDLSQFSNGHLSTTDLLSERSIEEVYYLWKLAGGDLAGTLRRAGVFRSRPPITKIACLVVDDGEMFGEDRDVSTLFDDTVTILSQEQLRQRLSSLDPTAYYPLLEDDVVTSAGENVGTGSRIPSSVSSTDLQESVQLPLIIREKDIEYQFHRIILFERLLIGYPYKKLQIMKEARTDIPPLYRPLLWAALLEIEGDVQGKYDSIDKESPISTDRQIEVDIPRCHQYNELLSSPTGHAKFKRLLKAWVVSHPEYVYWQGLDSMCAPFLYLNFNNEAIAFACLSAFIPKYLHNFFLKDNASVIQEYLAVFSHLIAFQDAELSTHLDDTGFIPDLYAIPWFLTMYAHVFPLHKIFPLWDTLLLGNSSFPLCIGVAILKQLRDQLLSFGFNECILLFSDMPEIDMERCVQDSIKVFCSTPTSATYRCHAAPAEQKKCQLSTKARPLHATPEKLIQSELAMEPIPLQQLKAERCCRISAEDLLELTGLRGGADVLATTKRTKSSRPTICIIDVRSGDEYRRCSIPDSINIPFSTAFTGEGELGVTSQVTQALQSRRSQVKVIVGSSRTKHATDFAEQLIRLKYNRVCVLHKGIDVLRAVGVLTVATPDL